MQETAVRQHLEETNLPTAIDIKHNIYVDNLVTGVENKNVLRELSKESKEKCKDVSMNLRKCVTNSQETNDQIKLENQIEKKIIDVLGLVFNTNTDELSISTKLEKNLRLVNQQQQGEKF